MEIDFTDIRIIGLEEEMTVESPVRPPLRYIYLRLSQTPIPIWQSYFEEVRRVARHSHWRHAWVDRRFIVVECFPEEIEKYHLADLKEDIAQVNQRCREYLTHQTIASRQKEHADKTVVERLKEMKNRLNFD